MGTRRNKKVDKNSNNKTRTQTDLAKSFRRRASDNEEITFGGTGETLADRKGKKGSQISSPNAAGGDCNHSETLKSLPLNSVELA